MIKRMLVKLLHEIANKIDNGTCELSEDEAMQLFDEISVEPMSKEQACEFLNISRSKFDSLVRSGKIPPGIKRTGFKELVWYKKSLKTTCKEHS